METVLAHPPTGWIIGQKPSKWRIRALSKTNESLIWSKSTKKEHALQSSQRNQQEMDQTWSAKPVKSKVVEINISHSTEWLEDQKRKMEGVRRFPPQLLILNGWNTA